MEALLPNDRITRHTLNFQDLYQAALRTQLEQGCQAGIESAKGLGIEPLAAGLPILDLAKLHEKALVMDLLPSYPAGRRSSPIKQTGMFFAAANLQLSVEISQRRKAEGFLKRICDSSHQVRLGNRVNAIYGFVIDGI